MENTSAQSAPTFTIEVTNGTGRRKPNLPEIPDSSTAPTKGWYWVLTNVHKKLAIRYFSGRLWKFHPGEVRLIRAPFRVISRIQEPLL